MSFLKSIIASSTSAIAGIATASSPFPYQEVRKLNYEGSPKLWNMSECERVSLGGAPDPHSSTGGSQSYTCFTRSLKGVSSAAELQVLRNACKRWKMIRHPKCLPYRDGHIVSVESSEVKKGRVRIRQ